MLIIQRIAEEKIQKAMANGEFDHLPGQGHPIDLSDYFSIPELVRLATSILNNANILPEEILLKKEIEMIKQKLIHQTDPEIEHHLRTDIMEKELQYRLKLELRSRNDLKKKMRGT